MQTEFGKIIGAQDEHALLKTLEAFKEGKDFGVLKNVADNIKVYKLDWYENRLHALESLDEGEITWNGKIKILRKYVCGKTQDSSFYDYYTRVEHTEQEKRGVMLLVHGFAQCSDVWMETQVQMAMNGYVVYAIDLEGYGYSAGARVTGLSIDKMHHQVATLLQLASTNHAGLPAFVMGHSMGGLVVSSFMHKNPEMAEKVAGVIYSAPLMGLVNKKTPSELWGLQ